MKKVPDTFNFLDTFNFFWITSKAKKVLPYFISGFFSSIIFLSICVINLCCSSVSTEINQFENIDNLYIAAGGMFGAIVTLTIALAIIPIQRAIEIFSPSIRSVYVKDIVVQGILLVLGLFIFLSFLLPFIKIPDAWKFFVLIELVAVSLDLVRWHFRRISFLLEPYNAIQILVKEVCLFVKRTQRLIAQNSYVELKKIPREQWSSEVLTHIEKQHYKLFEEQYSKRLYCWVNELEDITLRAVCRSERLTVAYGINAMVKIACTFLDSRKANFQIYPVDLFTVGSDIDKTINPVYEKMINICRLSIHNKDEQSAIKAVQGLSAISTQTLQLKGVNEYSAPLASIPIGYIKNCAEMSYASNLDEISWNVVNELLTISGNTPNDIMICDVHLPVIECLFSIAGEFYLARKKHIGNRAISNMCRIVCRLAEEKHYDCRSLLSQVLKKLEMTAPLMLLNEEASDMQGFPPYSVVSGVSLREVVAWGASHIELDPDRGWVNPYRDFMEVNEEVYLHLRHLAENEAYDIQNSFLSWAISDLIKQIARVYLNVIEKKITENSEHNKKLLNQVNWYQSFFWVMFDKRKEIVPARAKDVCDTMAIIGLQFANAGHFEVLGFSSSHICSVAKFYIERTGGPDEYAIADMLDHAWQLRHFAEVCEQEGFVNKADEGIEKTLILATEKATGAREAFETRKQQLTDFLGEYTPEDMPIFSRDWLKVFLRGRDDGSRS